MASISVAVNSSGLHILCYIHRHRWAGQRNRNLLSLCCTSQTRTNKAGEGRGGTREQQMLSQMFSHLEQRKACLQHMQLDKVGVGPGVGLHAGSRQGGHHLTACLCNLHLHHICLPAYTPVERQELESKAERAEWQLRTHIWCISMGLVSKKHRATTASSFLWYSVKQDRDTGCSCVRCDRTA